MSSPSTSTLLSENHRGMTAALADYVAWCAQPTRRQRQRRPTLASVAKQASKAGIEVARYEIKPDGSIVIVTGKSESAESNPWLDDLNKVTKQ